MGTPVFTTDSLSPMLVKELRQGVKSRSFGLAFMGLQALMALAISLQVLLASHPDSQIGLAVLFWCCVAVPVLLVLPLSALTSVQQERTGHTIELLHLTRLTPWRMAVGKWLSIMDRSLLLLTGVLPYLMFRYFIGGVNVVMELLLLGFVLLLAALETSICLFLSALTQPFLRWGLGFLLLFIVGVPSLLVFGFAANEPDRMLGVVKPGLVATVATATAATTLHFLAAAAGLIAPGAISYEMVKRLTSLLVIALVAVFACLIEEPELSYVAIFVAMIAGFGALAEHPRLNPMLFRDSSRNFWSRAAGRFFHPGWPTAVLYTLALFLVYHASIVVATAEQGADRMQVLAPLAGLAALLGALATVLLFRPNTDYLAGFFLLHLLIQLVCGIGVLMAGYHVVEGLPVLLYALMPLSGLLAAMDRNQLHQGTLEGLLALLVLASLAILAWRSAAYWRGLLDIERRWIAVFNRPRGEQP